MEILIVITTASFLGILYCLLQFEKRTKMLQDENEELAKRLEAVEAYKEAQIKSAKQSEKFKRFTELSEGFRAVR